ncbi:MAG: phosphomannomutase/phosphoglucomutase [Lentisphaeraceae bacterium]|nr:phosphomannomutase/phosphoglucomutase [Lentisphaeraceae bacterium]
MKVFKAYDIRGLYPEQINEELAFKVATAFAAYTGARTVVVGYDMRPSSKSLFEAICKGLTSQGIDVINIGLCSTPICYFANGSLDVDGSFMITASHNGAGWNGLKICKKNAVALSYKSGLKDLKEMIVNEALPEPKKELGKVINKPMAQAYSNNLRKYIAFTSKPKIVIDYGNAVGTKEIEGLDDLFTIIPLNEKLDGTFPNHEANPLKTETLKELQAKVIEHNADFGAAFDGDADRCGFIDEKGAIVGMDLMTAIIAEDLIQQTGPQTILYDLRSSKAVPEAIASAGGTPKMTPVGHAVIKERMREENAAFAGELSGHYYFKENYYSESQALVLILLCNILEKKKKNLSDLIQPLRKYKNTGEINVPVKDTVKLFQKLKEIYKNAKLTEVDGLSIEYEDWWCNVRASNTEPLLRVFVEAHTENNLETKREALLSIILASS